MIGSGSVIVSWDFTEKKGAGVLLVGKQTKGKVTVVNAFQGQEAFDLMTKLITKQSEKTTGEVSDE